MSLTQKLDDHSESGYKVYIPTDCTSINGVRTNYRGYAVVPPTGITLNSDIVKTIYADVNGDNSTRVQGTLDGTNIKFIFTAPEWKALNYSRVRDIKGNLIYNVQDYVKQLTPKITPKFTGTILNNLNDSVTYLKDNNDIITINAKDGYEIKDATLEYQPYPGASEETLGMFTVADNKKTAAINIPDNVKNNSSINLIISGNTTTDLEHINPSLKADNVTVSITGNTITLTANNGYKIKDATLDIGYSLFGDDTPLKFNIASDGLSASVTVTDKSLISASQPYDLTVKTEQTSTPTEPTKPSEPTIEKTFKGKIKLESDVEDKLTFNFDKIKTVTIKVTDNKYNINSLFIIYQPYPASGLEQSKNGFIIATDKKSATLVIPDEILDSLADDISIGGDVADTTPLTPSVAKTQRVYMVDDKGLNELTKQAESSYGGGMNVNYDFTEFINQLYYLPFTVDEKLSTPTNKIDTGLWSLNAPAREMKDNVLNIDLGAINVIPENNNGFDYNIESIKLYLPLVLPIQIDFQDCYKKPISINYKINLLTGNATINVLSNDKLISTFNQNVQTNLQMFSIYNNKDFGSINNSINNDLLTPYIKINYYKPVENLVSYETLEHNKLTSYTNFVKTRNSSVSCGTQQEQQEIESLLDEGVIINNPTIIDDSLKK